VTFEALFEFTDRVDLSRGSFQTDVDFEEGISDRIRVITAERVAFHALHANINLSLPGGKDVSGTFVFSYLNPSYTTSNVLLRGIFFVLGILSLMRLLPLPPYARHLAGLTLLGLSICMLLATDLFFLLPYYTSASAFRFIDASLTILFVCAAAFGTFLQLDLYVADSPRITVHAVAVRSIGFVLGFVAWKVVAVLSLVAFQKDYLLQRDILGWSLVLGLGVADLVAIATRLVKFQGINTAGNLVMAVMTLSLPLLVIGSRIAALFKEEIAWNLQLFDFLAATGVTVFFGLVCGPVVSESNEPGGDSSKSLSGFTPAF
jgi:hypothetical protein